MPGPGIEDALLDQHDRGPRAAARLAHGLELEPLHVGVAIAGAPDVVSGHQAVVAPLDVEDAGIAGPDLFAAGLCGCRRLHVRGYGNIGPGELGGGGFQGVAQLHDAYLRAVAHARFLDEPHQALVGDADHRGRRPVHHRRHQREVVAAAEIHPLSVRAARRGQGRRLVQRDHLYVIEDRRCAEGVHVHREHVGLVVPADPQVVAPQGLALRADLLEVDPLQDEAVRRIGVLGEGRVEEGSLGRAVELIAGDHEMAGVLVVECPDVRIDGVGVRAGRGKEIPQQLRR